MATLLELRELYTESNLINKIEASVCISVNTIKNELVATVNHAERLIWAKAAIKDTKAAAEQVLKIILAENAGATKSAILAASDASINTAVAGAVNFFSV